MFESTLVLYIAREGKKKLKIRTVLSTCIIIPSLKYFITNLLFWFLVVCYDSNLFFSDDRCNKTFLSIIAKGSISSEYTSTTAATCEKLWPNNSWYNYNFFVGLTNTQRCPAMNHCNNQIPLWVNGSTLILLLNY